VWIIYNHTHIYVWYKWNSSQGACLAPRIHQVTLSFSVLSVSSALSVGVWRQVFHYNMLKWNDATSLFTKTYIPIRHTCKIKMKLRYLFFWLENDVMNTKMKQIVTHISGIKILVYFVFMFFLTWIYPNNCNDGSMSNIV
jgi:hypothetical protein